MLSGTAPSLQYAPAANYFGPDSFTFTVSDGQTTSAAATVSITVQGVNDPPVAQAGTLVTNEDTSAALTLGATDVDGDTLTYVIVTAPTRGALSGTGASRGYAPNPNVSGADGVVFKVNDGTVDSAEATVAITITPVNDPPSASAQPVTTDEDHPLPITLAGTDVEGDTLSFAILTQPTNGTVTGTPPNVTFNPAPNFNGSTSFTFSVNDGAATSGPATVSITVTPVNDPPLAQPQTLGTFEDTPRTVPLAGFDPDGTPLTFTVLTQPANGALTGTPPSLTFTPASNFNGSTSFTFKVNDGTVDSAPATITLNVLAVNDVPSATPQSLSTNEDAPLAITLAGTDVENAPLTFTFDQPDGGALSGTPPALTFTPTANFNGTATFTFRANDGVADSAPATVTIQVQPLNDAPVGDAQSLTTNEDTALPIVLTGTDVEGSALTFAIAASPANGVLSGTPPNVTFTPAQNYAGPASFTFTVNDGTATSAAATVTITVTPVNDAPVATPQTIAATEDTPLTVTLAGTDVEGSTLTYSIVTPPSAGNLGGSPPNLTYSPPLNFSGQVTFTFKVNDGSADSAPATVTLNVAAVNDPPVGTPQSLSVPRNSTNTALTLAGTDVEGATLTFAIASPPTHGTLGGSGAARTYTPTAGYAGPDSFTFTANDGTTTSSPATVTIAVTSQAPALTNVPTTISCEPTTALTFSATASDPDADPLTFGLDAVNTTCAGVGVSAAGALTGGCPNTGAGCVVRVTVSDGLNVASANVTVSANTRFVTPTGAGTHDGTSWANAIAGGTNGTITAAATALGPIPAHFWLAAGSYRLAPVPTSTVPAVTLQANQRLFGGFVGTETTFAQRPSPVLVTEFNGDVNNNATFDVGDTAIALRLANNTIVDGIDVTNVLLRPGATQAAVNCVGAISATLRNVRFIKNKGANAAVLATTGCSLTVDGAAFYWNENDANFERGSSVRADNGSTLLVKQSVFVDNLASAQGPGVGFTQLGTLTIEDSLLLGSTAASGGAALEANGGTLTVRRSLITASRTLSLSFESGTVYSTGGTMNVEGTRVIDSSADAGPCTIHNAIYTGGTGTSTLTNVLVKGVRTGGKGAGIANGGQTLFVNDVTVSDVSVAYGPCAYGGGLMAGSGAATITNSAFYGNLENGTPRDVKIIAGAATSSSTCSATLGTASGNVSLSSSPFDPVVSGDTFLLPASACVNAGADAAATAAFTASGGPSWTAYTTRKDLALDTTPVDMGFHGDPATPRIDTFLWSGGNPSWVIGANFGANLCQLYFPNSRTFQSVLTASGAASGAGVPSGTRVSLICRSTKGPGLGAVAHLVVP